MRKRPLLSLLIVIFVSGLLCAGIFLHELIHEGNQSKLFFPSLQRAKAFQVITEVSYSGEEVLYFEYGSDWDADSWYYIVAHVDEPTLMSIVDKKSLTKLPFDPSTLVFWQFGALPRPKNPDYYSITFSRKGYIHLWYDREKKLLYLVDSWVG
jgi:hypothetical protein